MWKSRRMSKKARRCLVNRNGKEEVAIISRRFKSVCGKCGTRILLVQSGNGWTALDFPERRIGAKWLPHRCGKISIDSDDWIAEKMRWNLGSEY